MTLCGKCNAGTIFSKEKGMLLDMFSMWLVRNGIANLLSVPCLEREGCEITYGTNTSWIMNCPNGIKLKFKKGTGICEVFLYSINNSSDDGCIRFEIVGEQYT